MAEAETEVDTAHTSIPGEEELRVDWAAAERNLEDMVDSHSVCILVVVGWLNGPVDLVAHRE